MIKRLLTFLGVLLLLASHVHAQSTFTVVEFDGTNLFYNDNSGKLQQARVVPLFSKPGNPSGGCTTTEVAYNVAGSIYLCINNIWTLATNGSGVSSLNSLTGALSLTSNNSSVTITPSGSSIDLSVPMGGGTVTNVSGSSPVIVSNATTTPAISLASTTYYVSNSGSDSSNGTTQSTPFANAPGTAQCASTCAGVTLHPGDTVLFQRGGVWRDTLTPAVNGTSLNYINYAAYGTGLINPIITGSNLGSSWTFVNPSYSTAAFASGAPGNVIVDGKVRLTKVATSCPSTLTAGQWCYSSTTLFVRLAGDSNPSGHTIEGTVRSFAVNNTKAFLSFSNLTFYATSNVGYYDDENIAAYTLLNNDQGIWNDTNGFLLRSGFSTCTNCVASYNLFYGIATDAPGTGSHDITLNNPVTKYNAQNGVQITETTGVTINGGEAAFNGTASLEGDGISIVSASGVNATNISIYNFYAHDNLGNGLSSFGDSTPSGCVNILVSGGTWSHNITGIDPSSGIRFDQNTNHSTIQYAVVTDNSSGGIVNEVNANNNLVQYNIVARNNGGLNQTNGSGSGNVYNGNTVYGNTSQGYVHQTNTPAAAILKNNIFVANGIGMFSDGTGGTDTEDYNDVFGNGTNYSGITPGTHDISLDPLFSNPLNTDFRVANATPVNVGVALGTPYNLALDPATSNCCLDQNQLTAWYMGAFGPLATISQGPVFKSPSGVIGHSFLAFPNSGLYEITGTDSPILTATGQSGAGAGVTSSGFWFVGLPGSYFNAAMNLANAPQIFRLTASSGFGWTSSGGDASASADTDMSRLAPGFVSFDTGTLGNTLGFHKSAQTLQITAADVTCGTGGTISSCTGFQTITGLSVGLPHVAANWSFTCDLIVGQATAATANQIGVQTTVNTANNIAATATVATAAGVTTSASITGVSNTSSAQSVITFTPGAAGTKLPVHLAGTIEGTSASGTVFNVVALTGSNSDLLTIYRGSACYLY